MFFFRVHLRKPVQTMYSILLTIYICDEWICISVYVLQITHMGWKNDRSPYGSAHTNTQRQTQATSREAQTMWSHTPVRHVQ